MNIVNCPFGNPLLGTIANSEDPCGISLGSALFAILKPIIKARNEGTQWLSGRVFDLRPRGRRFEAHRRHCVVVLEQDTFILA